MSNDAASSCLEAVSFLASPNIARCTCKNTRRDDMVSLEVQRASSQLHHPISKSSLFFILHWIACSSLLTPPFSRALLIAFRDHFLHSARPRTHVAAVVLITPSASCEGFANVVFWRREKVQILETRTSVQSSLSKWEGSEGTCCISRSGQFSFHRLLFLDVVL
jgi:hypothetical protein